MLSFECGAPGLATFAQSRAVATMSALFGCQSGQQGKGDANCASWSLIEDLANPTWMLGVMQGGSGSGEADGRICRAGKGAGYRAGYSTAGAALRRTAAEIRGAADGVSFWIWEPRREYNIESIWLTHLPYAWAGCVVA